MSSAQSNVASEGLPTVFLDPTSEPCRSVHWLCVEADIPIKICPTWLGRGDHQQPGFLRINPRHQVPALKHGSFCLSECQAMMKYLCELQGIEATFFGATIHERASIAMILSWHHHAIRKFVMLNYNLPMYYIPFYLGEAEMPRPTLDEQRKLRTGFAESLQQLEDLLQGRAFLVGERLTVADMVVAPDLTAMDVDTEASELLKPYPALCSWLERLRAMPSFKRAHAGYNLAVPAMREHLLQGSKEAGDLSFMDLWTDPWIDPAQCPDAEV